MDNIQHQQMVQETVKDRFKGKKNKKSRVKPLYPDSAEREYKRLLNEYNKVIDDTLEESMPSIRAAYRRCMRTDARYDSAADFERELDEILRKVRAKLEQRLSKFRLEEKVDQIGQMTNRSTIRQWKRMVKKTLGVDLQDDYYKGDFYKRAVDMWVQDNVLKIKGLPQTSLDSVRQTIVDGYKAGKTIRELTSDIQSEHDVSRSYAKMLARDQVSTLNAQITQMQHSDAGVTKYEWSTSRDGRVRECHRALDGKIISWDDPPEMWYMTKHGIVNTGRKCHPGEDYQCRCCAIPVFDKETLNLPIKGKQEEKQSVR